MEDNRQQSRPATAGNKPSDHVAPADSKKVRSLSESFHDNLSDMGQHFRRGALLGFLLWLLILSLIFALAPSGSYEVSQGLEQQCFFSVFFLILVTNSSRFIPLALRENGTALFKSGVMMVVLVIQIVSMTGCLIIAVIPTPVLIDRFTGMRCHLVLWANFIALSFLMAFLTENLDATVKNINWSNINATTSKNKKAELSWFLASTISVSTTAGIIFPLCTNFAVWMISMAISWILFFSLYVSLFSVAMRFLEARVHRRDKQLHAESSSNASGEGGFTPEEDDCYELFRLSFIAHLVCALTWTLLAVGYCVLCFLQPLAPPESLLANPAFAVAFFCAFEVLSKVLFLSTLVEAYDSVFDETRRAMRHQRFNMEKKYIQEVTSRKKDAAAVRFTRHEVKNGILSAVGAVEQLEDIILSHKNSAGPATICNSLNDLQSSLQDVLDRVADDAMSREIVHGEYQPRYENLNIPALFTPFRRGALQRFTLIKSPQHFPFIRMDRALLRCIYRNILSNACRYGKPGGTVETIIQFDEKDRRFELQVTNLPGPGHDQLVQLNDDQVAKIFQQGTRLRMNRLDSKVGKGTSDGDGAWIVQNCAQVLGGNCSIRFTPTQSIFTFTCNVSGYFFEHTGGDGIEINTPTTVGESGQRQSGKRAFLVPPGTWGIGIDDSLVQRKLLTSCLQMLGVKKSRQIILGQNAEEIYGFREAVEKILNENPNSKVLVIADENLDIVEGGARSGTVSGSGSVEKLLSSLDKPSADRLLCLIRSANDSDADLRLYKSRSHGYLLKQPLKRDDITETVKQWWEARFSSSSDEPTADLSVSDNESESSRSRIENRTSATPDPSRCDSVVVPLEDDIRIAMAVIDSLFDVQAKSSADVVWPALQDRLFALKGDLKTVECNTDEPERRLGNLIAHTEWPENAVREWLGVRKQIDALFEA